MKLKKLVEQPHRLDKGSNRSRAFILGFEAISKRIDADRNSYLYKSLPTAFIAHDVTIAHTSLKKPEPGRDKTPNHTIRAAVKVSSYYRCQNKIPAVSSIVRQLIPE